VSIKHLEQFYDAFSESFESVRQYYIPAWSRYEALPSQQEMEEFLRRTEKEFHEREGFLFSAFDKDSGRFIGQGELHHVDMSVPKARLGYWVRQSESGQGYASELALTMTYFGFDILKCRRLEIRNEVRNKASAQIARKIGYQYLTVFEKNKVGRDGEFWDLEIYCKMNKQDLMQLYIDYQYDQG
jgi:RimJ/RimL family protein N-acetyltransferase